MRKQRYSIHNSRQCQLFQGIQRFLTPQKSVGCGKGYCVSLCVAESGKQGFVKENSGLCYALRKYSIKNHENSTQKRWIYSRTCGMLWLQKNKNEGGKYGK